MKKITALMLAALMLALAGCNADCASPFDAPDGDGTGSTQPVVCANPESCK